MQTGWIAASIFWLNGDHRVGVLTHLLVYDSSDSSIMFIGYLLFGTYIPGDFHFSKMSDGILYNLQDMLLI